MLLTLGLLASCKPAGNPDDTSSGSGSQSDTTESMVPSAKTISIDISKYTLIRPENTTSELKTACSKAYASIQESTNAQFADFKDDWLNTRKDEKPGEFEILVGNTNRDETKKVYKALEGATFAISFVNNKLVIVGANDSLTIKGLEYFVSFYASKTAGDGKISLAAKDDGMVYLSQPASMISIAKDGVINFKVVFSEDLDSKYSSNPEDNDRTDIEVEWAKNIRQTIMTLTNIDDCDLANDWIPRGQTEDTEAFEILVGATNRTATADVMKDLGYNEYAVRCIGNKVVVTGWDLTSTERAVKEFISLLNKSVASVPGQSYKNISFLGDTELHGTVGNFFVDIPTYEGGSVAGTYDCNNDNYMIYISGTKNSEFASYCSKLENAGFKLYDENTIGKNSFKTYTSGSRMVHTYFYETTGEVRIITSPVEQLPDKTVKEYKKIAEPSISQMTLNYAAGNFGMNYVITLEDGSFILYDGGGSSGNSDHDRLYELLASLNKAEDGKIHIAAWIITHDHWDHTSVFGSFANKYADKAELGLMILNRPTASTVYNSINPNHYVENNLVKDVAKLNGTIVKCHTGMKYYFAGATLEVLYTHEDLYPSRLRIFNNSSTVTRLKIGDKTATFLGDIQTAASKVITSVYELGDLKSDIVQVAHHGYDGATQKVYLYLSPEVLFWPTDTDSFNKQTSGTNLNGYRNVDYYLATKMGVKKIIVAGKGTETLPINYTLN